MTMKWKRKGDRGVKEEEEKDMKEKVMELVGEEEDKEMKEKVVE